jgi:hypothetical protein
MRALLASVVAATVVGGLTGAVRANESSAPKSREAMVVCESVDHMAAGDKQKKLARLGDGVMLAQAAVAADDHDVQAHLALICNLGKALDLAGLSWRVFGQLRRLQAEVDHAQEIAPDDSEVLVAKAEVLRRVPGPLGGNKDLARTLLLRAVQLEPDNVTARLYLAHAMAEDRSPEARARTYEALALAKKRGAVREQTDAQELLASLDK